jgi:hypothetical protein
MRRSHPLQRAFRLGFRHGYLRGLARAHAELETELARATESWDTRLCELEQDYELLVRKMRNEQAAQQALLERDPNAWLN